MRTRDLLALCFQNLFRRKSRTILTILGVVIGCCAIVIMVSIGIGSKEAQEKMLSQMGDLTVINVYDYSMWGESNGSDAKLTDDALDSFRAIPGVEVVTPKYQAYDFEFKVYAGPGKRYEARWLTVFGLSDGAMEALGYELKAGEFNDGVSFGAVAGQMMAYNFRDTKRPDGYNMVDWWADAVWDPETGEYDYSSIKDPYFDPMNTTMELEINCGEGKKPIKQKITVTGIAKQDYSKGWETSEGLIMRLDDLLLLREQYRKATGYKADKDKVDTYENVTVKCTSMDRVAEIEETIKEQGFNTSSMESIRKPLEEQSRKQMLLLGGLGAISLLVAAISIMNTMIMSITERTREIGIMKALGCRIRDLRTQFLTEAGLIGVVGGVAGVILSYVASIVMNLVTSQIPVDSIKTALTILTEKGGRMSVVPIWLAAFGLVFSAMIGLVSGYGPAVKATKVSALEAIRHE